MSETVDCGVGRTKEAESTFSSISINAEEGDVIQTAVASDALV